MADTVDETAGPAHPAQPPDASAQPPGVSAQPPDLSAQPPDASAQPPHVSAHPPGVSAQPPHLSAQPPHLSAQPPDVSAQPPHLSAQPPDVSAQAPHLSAQAPDALPEQAAELAVALTEAGEPRTPLARRLMDPVTSAALASARMTGSTVRAARRQVRMSRHWLATQVIAMAPRLKIRDQATLRAQFPGLDSDGIADALIETAARASAAVGGAVGAWAAVPTTLPAFPAEVLTETVALVGIEIKLVAELHEAYGVPAPGGRVERATGYIASWAHRRGVFMVPGGLALTAGSPLARQLQRRLSARAGRSAFSLGPLLTGAVAGAFLNRRETRRLGREIQADLRSQSSPIP